LKSSAGSGSLLPSNPSFSFQNFHHRLDWFLPQIKSSIKKVASVMRQNGCED
jgi:hypothetical protein